MTGAARIDERITEWREQEQRQTFIHDDGEEELEQRLAGELLLVPVGRAVDGVEGKARRFRDRPPAGPFSAGEASHQPPPKEEKPLPLLPKPPNETLLPGEDAWTLPDEAELPEPVETFVPEPVQ